MIPVSNTALEALLVAVVVLPLLGAVAALLPAPPGLRGRGPAQAVLRHGVLVTGLVFAAAVVLALGFDRGHAERMQAQTAVPWASVGVEFHLGVDGVSLPLLVLTALLTFLCAVYSYCTMPKEAKKPKGAAEAAGVTGQDDGAAEDARRGSRGPSPRAFTGLLLLLESGMLAAFASLDLLLFFVAFEMVLVPMYFFIAFWGRPEGPERRAAAWKFVLYTQLGSMLMLVGFLAIGTGCGYDMLELAGRHSRFAACQTPIGHGVQLVFVLAAGIGLAVKTPMWPLHSWLPDAHTAAPTVGSVLLAGVLLKMGTYGFVRVLLPIAPGAMHTFAPYLAAFAVVGIVYGSLACLALARKGAGGDLKRLIAYSSVGHMGFVLLGISTMTRTGVNGALFANVAHGLVTGLLFFLVGAVKERTGTTDLDALAGRTGGALYARAPRLGGLLAFGAVASLGLPGLAGFWGEMLALLGAYHPADGLGRTGYLVFMAIGALGTLLTAAYLLVVVRRVCMGDPSAEDRAAALDGADGAGEAAGSAASGATRTDVLVPSGARTPPAVRTLPDVRGHEYAATTPLVALTVLAGLWPALLLGLTSPAVQHLLPGVNR